MTPPLRHDGPIDRVYFTADSRRLATVSGRGVVRFWDVETGRPLTEWLRSEEYWGASFDPVNGPIAVGAEGGALIIWSVPSVAAPVPGWFPTFAEAVAGLRWVEHGAMELVPSRVFAQLAQPPLSRPGPDASGDLNTIYDRTRWRLLTAQPSTPAGPPR